MTNETIWGLKQQLERLRALKDDSYTLTHGIKVEKGGEWQAFVPTNFIYSMFTFNMLYNIDWEKSVQKGYIVEFSRSICESKKITSYLTYFFSKPDFMNEKRKAWFREIVLAESESVESIMNKLSLIKPDTDNFGRRINRNRGNGNIYDYYYIKKFQQSVEEVLRKDESFDVPKLTEFSEGNINRIYDFIYKIRCNIFHGIKSIWEMEDVDQQDRIKIYTRFLYAANSIAFDYIHYLFDELGGNTEESEFIHDR